MKTFDAILKITAAQALLQGVCHLAGGTIAESSLITCGLMVVAPLYSLRVRRMYSTAFGSRKPLRFIER